MYFHLTPKQHELIVYIYRFRFLNRIQLQTLLKHKDKRRINAWLKELTEQNYLGRIYSTKLLENTKPAIYYLSHAGILYLRDWHVATEHQLKKYYGDKSRSRRFIDHSILLGSIYLQLQQKVIKKLQFFTPAEFHESELLQEIHPSAYYNYYKKGKTKHYFVELFDEGMPRFALRYRIKEYISFFWSGQWKQGSKHPFTVLLLICPNKQIQKFLEKFISTTVEEEGLVENLIFSLTTKNTLEAQGLFGKIWTTVEK
jgi:hypothetical protein